MSSTAARTYEQQNDAALSAIHSQARNLHSVTLDIHSDAEAQRASLLPSAERAFEGLGRNLHRSSTSLTQKVVNLQGWRLTLTVMFGVIFLWILYRLFR